MELINYYNYNEYVDECKKYGLDDDYIYPPDKYCSACALYSFIWNNWYKDDEKKGVKKL